MASDSCFADTNDGGLTEWDGRISRNARGPVDNRGIFAIKFTWLPAACMVGGGFFANWDGGDWKQVNVSELPRIYDLHFLGSDWC